MVKLGDYIGLILSEITTARVQADIESIRMAELYSTNKTLRNFPVPRVRIQNVEITTPIAIDKADEAIIEAAKKPINLTEVRTHVDQALATSLEKNKVKLSTDEMSIIKKSLDDKFAILRRRSTAERTPATARLAAGAPGAEPSVTPTDTKNLSDEITTEIEASLKRIKATRPDLKDEDVAMILREMKIDLRSRLSSLRPPPPRLDVIISTAQIKEIGPKETITMIKLTIIEDAMEWTEYETTTGEVKEHLVPE